MRLLLLRAPSARHLLDSFEPSDTCQDSCPPSTSLRSVHVSEGFQVLTRSVLRCSQPLDGLLRSGARGLVSSHSRSQGHCSFKGSFSPRSRALSSRVVAPSSLPRNPSPASEWPEYPSLDLEAFLHAKARAVSSVVSLPPSRSLLRVRRFLQVLSSPRNPSYSGSNTPGVSSCPPSTPQAASLLVRPRLQRFGSEEPGRFISSATTCSNFSASRSCSTDVAL